MRKKQPKDLNQDQASVKYLKLNKETLAVLESAKLREIAGGTTTTWTAYSGYRGCNAEN
jgi:hypothetical protein